MLFLVRGRYTGVVHNEESFNYGEYLYEETAVVKDIDLNNEKITVSIENSDYLLESRFRSI